MLMEELRKLLQNGDSTAIQRTRDFGSAALPTLEAIGKHNDEDVRCLVVECLAAIGTADALRRLPAYCEDSSFDVRLEAVNALLENQPVAGMADELLGIFARQKNGFLRRQLALVLGRLEANETKSRLRTHLHAADVVSDGLVAALARLGDPAARQRLGELLRTAQGERVVDALQLFRYVAHDDCVPLLLPLLEREDVVQNLSNDLCKIERRSCDLAFDELLRLRPDACGVTPHQDLTPYSADELAAVRALLRTELTE